ncbi:minor capsid protein [Vagococcus sp. PNs007]|uniref:Minor capsid protein n=1 Tax=Vagococcus proximus TaxID=2991417 RepID=A0ABT5X323_9ENTE|nr:minor capsid protein [Vagococcus proximus]MDF0480266.1 minor capsid protein [Vagococcus proximus]
MSYKDMGGKKKLSQASEKALEAVSTQVAVNSNQYVAKDSGVLEASVYSASEFQKGKVIWATKYAARIYFTRSLKLKRNKNPNASHLWFEVAKNKKLSDWIAIGQSTMKEHL